MLAACARKPVDRPPVWLMRQAGRYLPEYRLLRARHDFSEIAKTPELACEASLQPWQRFGMDAVIVFSDILFVPEAMGMKLKFKKDGGPELSPLLKSATDVDKLLDADAKTSLSFAYAAIRLLKNSLHAEVPVIGFTGAPWTLADYMIDGGAKAWIDKESEALKKLLEKLSKIVANYVRHQQDAGADVIQIFDTWAGELTRDQFAAFALPFLKEIVRDGKQNAPFIIYSRKCSHILNELADTGADVVSIDPETSMESAIKKIGGRVAIQGNLDPKLFTTTPGFVRQETSRLLSKIKGRPGHIINAGHGLLPTTLPECVEAVIETVKHWRFPPSRE